MVYDLEKEEFFPLRKNQKNTYNYQVPLHVLINTADFRKFAREKLEKNKHLAPLMQGDSLINGNLRSAILQVWQDRVGNNT